MRAGAGLAPALLLAMLLSGCASLTPPPATPPGDRIAAETAQRARAHALGLETGDCAAPGWTMAGRGALSNGRQGGSGRIEWTQGAGSMRLQLSAPVTRQSWVLEVDASGATLQGVAGALLRDVDAARLLREATGWDIPVAALGCWLRALAADPARFGPAQTHYAADLLPRRIDQNGWIIEYDGWQPDPFSGLPMPARIEARRGKDRVRLVADRWGLE